jgi:hypothetical protein
MGTLVFQATLGGAVNLIGPNIAGTVNFTLPSADGSSGQAISTNGSGVLSFGTLAVTAGGTGVTTSTGSGNNVLSTSPTLVTPILGTPSSGTLTNCTGLPNAGLVNSSITVGGTAIALGASSNALANDITVYGLTVGRGGGSIAGNTALGYTALAGTNSGSNANVAVGYEAMYTNTTGTSNAVVGFDAMYFNTTGSYNTAIGRSALEKNTTASNNTAVGYQAGYSNQTGAGGTYLGYQAGYSTTSTGNTFVGFQTGYNVTSGIQNVFVGYWAGLNTTGSANTFIGAGTSAAAGYSVTTGAKNTILGGYTGNQGGLDIRTSNNYVVLSDGDGNIVLSTRYTTSLALYGALPQTGTGITFPATRNASADANTLDDFEEGTWTPTCVSSGGTITIVGTVGGTYQIVGSRINAQGFANITTNGTGSGVIILGGLPTNPSSNVVGYGTETSVTYKALAVLKYTTSALNIAFYDHTYPGANGALLSVGYIDTAVF